MLKGSFKAGRRILWMRHAPPPMASGLIGLEREVGVSDE